MKRVLCLILVFVSLFALASCSSKKKKDNKSLVEEEVTKEISAEEGGKIESSDGGTSIEIPADALENDTKITMRIYSAADFPSEENEKIVSKVVEFEPSGTIFKKPVIIKMTTTEAFENKILTAAVFKEAEKKWSYSEEGTYAVLGKSESGETIITTASGDSIMLNADGDPITMSAAGDPIMMSAAGDPIMLAAAGDPIMNSAAGDPIMMTTGHFTTFTFITLKLKPVEEPTEEPEKDDEPAVDEDNNDIEITDEDEDTDTSDIEISDEDEIIVVDEDEIIIVDEDEITDEDEEIIVPEPPKVYSKVLCTGMAICTDGEGKQILCPKENEELYGQDAQYASRKGCVPHSYTEIENPEEVFIPSKATVQAPPFIKDDVTGLTWWFTGRKGSFEELKDECSEYSGYGEIDDWRLPTPQEVATLSDLGMLYGSKIDPVYFAGLYSETAEPDTKSYDYDLILTSLEGYFYMLDYGVIAAFDSESGYLMCVSGEKYGEVSAETYSSVTENGDEMISDSSTNLFWQKEPVKKATWKEALDYCESLDYAGHSDWRLPNKNEFLSLVDYSKIGSEVEETLEDDDEVEAISSFPGMTPDAFWTSTPAAVDYLVWLIHMQYGFVVPSGEAENSEDEPIVGPQQPQTTKSIKRDEIAEEEGYSVLCVRSDLDKKEEIPECNGTGTGPCIDSNGTIWSSRIYPEIFVDFDKSFIEYDYGDNKVIYTAYIAEMCRTLNENGSNKWRLPTIDEIRSILTTEKLKKDGGTCGVTDESEYSYSEDACTGDEPSKTILNDFGAMLSGSMDDESYRPWLVNVKMGELDSSSFSVSPYELVQRCVLDENLGYETAPYNDPESNLTWSDISQSHLTFSEAELYCDDLNEDPNQYWRIPTLNELKTLVRNCEEADAQCPADLNGRYSIFGDTSDLWARDEENKIYNLRFTNVEIYNGEDNSYYTAKIRCVSSGPSPCLNNNFCASDTNSTGKCIPVSSEEYKCECTEEYLWYGTECVKVSDVIY